MRAPPAMALPVFLCVVACSKAPTASAPGARVDPATTGHRAQSTPAAGAVEDATTATRASRSRSIAAAASAVSAATSPEAEATTRDCVPRKFEEAPKDPPAVIAEGPNHRCAAGMVFVRGGTFTMGPVKLLQDRHPQVPEHRAWVQSFCIDKLEVSRGDFARCKDCKAGRWFELMDGKLDDPLFPMSWVNPSEAAKYCARLGKRLPTEEEWEYAARAPGPKKPPEVFPSMDDLCLFARHKAPMLDLCRVGTSPGDESGFGVMDMMGNVREITSSVDCTCTAGLPRGARCRSGVVLRGGNAMTEENAVLGERNVVWDDPDGNAGFRCATTLD